MGYFLYFLFHLSPFLFFFLFVLSVGTVALPLSIECDCTCACLYLNGLEPWMWKHWREGGLRVYLQHFCIVQKRDENLRRGKMSLFWVYLLLFVAWVSICPTEGSEGNIFWLVLSAQLSSDADGSNVIKINNDWVFLKARPSLSSTEKRWSVTSLKIQLTGNNKLTVTIMCRHSLMWSMDRPFAFCKYEPLTKAVCVCVWALMYLCEHAYSTPVYFRSWGQISICHGWLDSALLSHGYSRHTHEWT